MKKIATLPGNRGVQMLVTKTAEAGDVTVVSFWDSIEAIKGYAGADYMNVRDLPRDGDFPIDHERLVKHYDLDVNFWQAWYQRRNTLTCLLDLPHPEQGPEAPCRRMRTGEELRSLV